MGDMMGQMDAMMGAGNIWGGLMILVLLMVAAGVVAVGVLAVRQRPALTSKSSSTEDEALRILRERYARSEIDEDEFLRRQSALMPY